MSLSNLAKFLHARARLNFRALYLGDQQTTIRCQHRMKLLRRVDGDYGADRSCCVVMDKQFHFSPLLADDAKVHAITVDVGSPNVFDIEQKPAATTRVCDYADVLYTEDCGGVLVARDRHSGHRPRLQVTQGYCPPIVHISGAHRIALHRYPRSLP